MEPGDATSTFVVRMWAETVPGEEPAWRGSIDDVIRRRRLFFTNLGAMCEFIVEQRRLAVPRTIDEDKAEE
jgi:hypothetical protein